MQDAWSLQISYFKAAFYLSNINLYSEFAEVLQNQIHILLQ